MTKTIAALALLASSSHAMALVGPEPRPMVTICAKVVKAQDGSKYISCDATELNKGLKVKQNGCPAGQISLTVEGKVSPLDGCLPPGMVQL